MVKLRDALDAIVKTVGESRLHKAMKRVVHIDGWTIATDGHRLLGVLGNHADPDASSDGFPKCREWLDGDRTGVPVSPEAFAAFVGTIPTPGTCAACDGDGYIMRDCEHCEETHRCECRCDNGKERITARPVKVGKAVLDANLLADVLPLLTSDGEWNIQATNADDLVWIFAQEWTFIVMPLRYSQPTKEFPLKTKKLARGGA